jgi:hypothetical protein
LFTGGDWADHSFGTAAGPPRKAAGPAATTIAVLAVFTSKHQQSNVAECELQQRANDLRYLAGAVRRTGYCWRETPEAIASSKDSIAKALIRMAREIGGTR